jgi:hypothetical protein
MKKTVVILIFLGLTQAGFSKETGKIWTVYFHSIKGEKIAAYCEVAETEKEKRRGLMFREKLDQDECMIFVYDTPIILSFWMKNTVIPLSISFIDSGLQIIDIYDMKPADETILTSTLPGIYAIEVNKGWYRKNYIFHGSHIQIVKKDMRNQ